MVVRAPVIKVSTERALVINALVRLFRGTIARAREDATQTVEVATLELAHAAPRLELARALVLEKHDPYR